MTYTGFSSAYGFIRQFFSNGLVYGRSGGGMTAVAAMKTSRFRQGVETSPCPGNCFCGVIEPTANWRSKLSPMKPQLRGAFALQAKNLTYNRRRFDREIEWAFIKK
jgi:hypothetical protein